MEEQQKVIQDPYYSKHTGEAIDDAVDKAKDMQQAIATAVAPLATKTELNEVKTAKADKTTLDAEVTRAKEAEKKNADEIEKKADKTELDKTNGELATLGSKTKDIRNKEVQNSVKAIIIEDSNNNEIVHIDEYGVDVKDLKSNGIKVLTELDGATKDEVNKKQDIVPQVNQKTISQNIEEVIFEREDTKEPILKIGNYGIKATAFYDINGNPIEGGSHSTQWRGKKCVCLGTSLTANGGWSDVIKSRFGFSKMYNRGLGGSTLANFTGASGYATGMYIYDDNSRWDESWDSVFSENSGDGISWVNGRWYSSSSRINLLPTDADLVLIDIGTNDYSRTSGYTEEQYDSWIGRINMKTPYREGVSPFSYDDTKFCDAFMLMVKKIMQRCPKAKIVVWCMPYNYGINSVGTDGELVNLLERAEKLCNIINMLCFATSCEFIDMFKESGINWLNVMEYCEDGVHPYKPEWSSEKGKYAIANVITKHLNNIYPKDFMFN